jgi:hypothetical protein
VKATVPFSAWLPWLPGLTPRQVHAQNMHSSHAVHLYSC